MALSMSRVEKRSVLIVWQTTEIVIEKLSKDFVQKFSHLKTQGVLQLIVGGKEIDFSYYPKPQLHTIEVTICIHIDSCRLDKFGNGLCMIVNSK